MVKRLLLVCALLIPALAPRFAHATGCTINWKDANGTSQTSDGILNGSACDPLQNLMISGSAVTATNGVPVVGVTGAAGDASITTGGTVQTLFSAVTPTNGWAVYNPNASDDCWVSDSTTAAVNGQGSIRVAANGGGYETPTLYRPVGAVSVICPTTGDKVTARRW